MAEVPDELAGRLEHLFETHGRNGKALSLREVSEALGRRISPSYLGRLRSGAVSNPSRRVISELAAFFKVPESYLLAIESQQTSRAEPADDPEVGEIARRATRLTPKGRRFLARMAIETERLLSKP